MSNFDISTIESKICTPALIYLVVSSVMALVGALMTSNTVSLAALSGNFLGIFLCTLVLMGLCNLAPQLSWAIVLIFLALTLIGIIAMLGGLLGFNRGMSAGRTEQQNEMGSSLF